MKKIRLMKKIITVISLMLVMSTVLSVTTFAALPEDNSVQPLWDSIFEMELIIVYNDGVGTASAFSIKQSTADYIEGTVDVYQQVNDRRWMFIDGAHYATYGQAVLIEVDFPAESGVTYKAAFTVVAETNGVGESHTIYYTETCP